MASLSWVHCNICFHFLSDKDRKFFMLNCQIKHILCLVCMNKTDKGKTCPICKTPIRFIELNNQAPAEVKNLFNSSAAKQSLKSFVTTQMFQKRQRNILIKHLQSVENDLKKTDELLEHTKQKIKDDAEKLERAQKYRAYLERTYQELLKEEKSNNSPVNQNDKIHLQAASMVNPNTSSQKSEALPSKVPTVIPFHSQKTSTPIMSSQNKVLNAAFSFESTPRLTE